MIRPYGIMELRELTCFLYIVLFEKNKIIIQHRILNSHFNALDIAQVFNKTLWVTSLKFEVMGYRL